MTEEFDVEAFARATRRGQRIRLTLVAAVIASPFLYLGWKCHSERAAIDARHEAARKAEELSASETAELQRLVVDGQKPIAAAQAAWKANVTPAMLATIVPDDYACPVELRAPTIEAGQSYAELGSIDGNYMGNAWFTLVARGAPIADDRLATQAADLETIAKQLRDGTATKRELSDARSIASHLGTTVFVVGTRKDPVVVADSYLAGAVTGTAYVYSYDEGRVVCTGALDVANSEAINIRYTYMQDNALDQSMKERSAAKATLDRDLDVQVQRALAHLHGVARR